MCCLFILLAAKRRLIWFLTLTDERGATISSEHAIVTK